MSSFNIKSKVIANRDATPAILTDGILATGNLQEMFGTDQLPLTADIGSQVRLISVPSSARVSELSIINAGIGTSSLDVAVWYPTIVPVASSVVASRLISSSAFATAIAGVDGGTSTDGMGTLTANTLARRTQPLWQSLGLVSDPMLNLDIGYTVRSTNSIAGYVGLRGRFVR